jgi:hypothetical protein
MDIYVNGTVQIDKRWAGSSERNWKFTGKVTIKDTYTFPEERIRMWFSDYAAAHELEKRGYKSFHVIMTWDTTMSGDGTYTW